MDIECKSMVIDSSLVVIASNLMIIKIKFVLCRKVVLNLRLEIGERSGALE